MKYKQTFFENSTRGTLSFLDYVENIDRDKKFFNTKCNLILQEIDWSIVTDRQISQNISMFLSRLSFLLNEMIESENISKLPKLRLSQVDEESYALSWRTISSISECIFYKTWDESFWVQTGKEDDDSFSKSGNLTPDRFDLIIKKIYSDIEQYV